MKRKPIPQRDMNFSQEPFALVGQKATVPAAPPAKATDNTRELFPPQLTFDGEASFQEDRL